MEHSIAGKIVIAPEVLVTIARMTALSVPGVVRMAGAWGLDLNRLLRSTYVGNGVRLDVEENTVSIDLYLVLRSDVNMLQVGRQVQSEVARAIHEMVGMDVREVNVHIEDVVYPEGEE